MYMKHDYMITCKSFCWYVLRSSLCDDALFITSCINNSIARCWKRKSKRLVKWYEATKEKYNNLFWAITLLTNFLLSEVYGLRQRGCWSLYSQWAQAWMGGGRLLTPIYLVLHFVLLLSKLWTQQKFLEECYNIKFHILSTLISNYISFYLHVIKSRSLKQSIHISSSHIASSNLLTKAWLT